MKKVLIVLFGFFLVASSLEAQDKHARTIYFTYENGHPWSHPIGDTLTGVAAGAASLDTIAFSTLDKDGRFPSLVLVAVRKDTSFLNDSNGKIDTTIVRVFRGVSGFYTTRADTAGPNQGLSDTVGTSSVYSGSLTTLGFVTSDFIFEIDMSVGKYAASSIKLVFDNTLVANTDSTAYRVRIVGIYDN